MGLSAVLLGTEKRTLRENAKIVLTNVNQLLVSISHDGAMLFNQTMCCGILDSDSIQYYPYVLKIDILEACPFGPPIISVDLLDKLARRFMRGKEVTLD
jgi:hypothetical protein